MFFAVLYSPRNGDSKLTLFCGGFSFLFSRFPMMAVTAKASASTSVTEKNNYAAATASEAATAEVNASSTAIYESGATIVAVGGRDSATIPYFW